MRISVRFFGFHGSISPARTMQRHRSASLIQINYSWAVHRRRSKETDLISESRNSPAITVEVRAARPCRKVSHPSPMVVACGCGERPFLDATIDLAGRQRAVARPMPLPPKSPELNPVENLWQIIRDNWLSNRVFRSYDDILDHCCHAWNEFADQPWTIMSIGLREWAYRF